MSDNLSICKEILVFLYILFYIYKKCQKLMISAPQEWVWTPLPPDITIETPEVLKKALEAQLYLSEQKDMSQNISTEG